MENIHYLNFIPKPIINITKFLVIFLLYWGMYQVFIAKDGSLESLVAVWDMSAWQQLLIGVVFLFSVPNWLIEAKKWQISLLPVQQISFLRSVLGVFRGLPLAMFTPNRVGEAFGRPSVLFDNNRTAGVFATCYCGLAQMPVMLFSAILALAWFGFGFSSFELQIGFIKEVWFIILLLVGAIFVSIVFFSPQSFIPFARKKKFLREIIVKLDFFSQYTVIQKIYLLIFALIRYLVYCVQNYILLRAFGVRVDFCDGLAGIFIVYVMMSFIPRPALAEFGVRCSFTVLIFGQAVDSYASLALSSALLWVINIMIPSALSIFTFFISKK